MALTCSLSNEVPEQPVLSPVSHCVFERRLIEKYIAENGVDPINGQPLAEDDLIEIKTSPIVRPRPPSATSIPAIIKLLQDEWDACMLHSFTQRQQLQTAKQELSHALYQHDAACRVIARLTKEANAAREALAQLKPQAGIAPIPAAMPVSVDTVTPMTVDVSEGGEMTEHVIQKLDDTAAVLTAERKKRGKKVPEGLAAADDIRGYKQQSSHSGLHSVSTPGILGLDLCMSNTDRVVTGGADKNAIVFDRKSEEVVATLKGHTKKVTSVLYHPREDVAVTASPDASIRVWSIPTSSCSLIIKAHDSNVTGISIHATGDYLLSSSTDQHWAFSDMKTGRVLAKVADPLSSAVTCTQFHPDGLIFGTGTADSVIKIWDLKEKANVANFPGHTGQITSIAFSENGYYLATAAEDAQVKLWDLRKLKNFKIISLDDGYEVKSLTFDQSGTYLAVAGTDVRVFLCKQWTQLADFTEHSGLATGVKFGQNAAFIASSSLDRSLKFYGH
ncbi:pre-mRNA-processing factor 19-like [Corticium candelabrum]|uniref:pre-mRNA-processing factor 19-like n=1 Tax=Corticium candelabrum TaxID=121492 RepID=UPI002E270DAE|nr:pre-mRNA-processing factor 19-like [Corticium candelabrum]